MSKLTMKFLINNLFCIYINFFITLQKLVVISCVRVYFLGYCEAPQNSTEEIQKKAEHCTYRKQISSKMSKNSNNMFTALLVKVSRVNQISCHW